MENANEEIRRYAGKNGVKLWQVAEALGIQDGTLSRKMRYELPQSKKQEILDIIDDIANGQKIDRKVFETGRSNKFTDPERAAVIANRITKAMENAGISNVRLAKIIGINPVMICNYRTGSNIPTVFRIIQIADALNVSTDYLLGRTE